MVALGVIGLIMSLVSYILCFVVFGGLSDDPSMRKWVFICFIAKAVIWSPFLGLEYYDMVLEQIYHDVQFQLNVIKADGSRSTSPRQESHEGPRGGGKKLQAIPEHQHEAQLEISEEENEKSSGHQTRSQHDESHNNNLSLLKPTSTGNFSSSNNTHHDNHAVGGSHDVFKPVEVRDVDCEDALKNQLMI